jgi:hypothetical protein
MATAPKLPKLPKTLGACADRLYELKDLKKQAKEAVDILEAEEKSIKEHIINSMPKTDSGAAGKYARVSVVTKQVPQLKDDAAFFAYVKKHNRFDLMQRRLADAAVKEMWDAGKEVPGIEAFTAVTISLNKI